MIFLATIIHLPVRVIGWIGVALIVFHNAFDHVQPQSWGRGRGCGKRCTLAGPSWRGRSNSSRFIR